MENPQKHKNDDLQHFLAHQVEALEGSSEAKWQYKIFCQISTHQSFHMSTYPGYYRIMVLSQARQNIKRRYLKHDYSLSQTRKKFSLI